MASKLNQTAAILSSKTTVCLICATLLAVITWIRWFYFNTFGYSGIDLRVIWSGGCLARDISGNSCPIISQPPDSDAGANVIAMYPPWAIPVLYWISSLAFEKLIVVWYHVSIISLAICSGLTTYLWYNEKLSAKAVAATIIIQEIAFFTFPPVPHSLSVGQFAPLQLLLFEIGAILIWNCNKTASSFLGGILWGLVAIKPQVFSLVIILGFLALQKEQKWKLVFLGFFASLASLTALAIFLVPNILSYFLNRTQDQMFYVLQPNLGSYLWHVADSRLMFIPFILAVALVVFNKTKYLTDKTLQVSIIFMLPLGLFVGPYVNAYDLLFLLPSFICSVSLLFSEINRKRIIWLGITTILIFELGCYLGYKANTVEKFMFYSASQLIFGMFSFYVAERNQQKGIKALEFMGNKQDLSLK